jgi:thiamine-phosphate pyrophosphorylase
MAASARDIRVLGAMARRLNKACGKPGLPPLLLLTDPKRTPDPLAAAARLPRGAGVIYRHFGAPDRAVIARRLALLCRRRGMKLLIGADATLAGRVGASGVHLPERLARLAPSLRRRRPDWLIALAAHRPGRVPPDVDALILAPLLPSASPSAARPLGARRGGAIAARAQAPVYALGGISARSIARTRLGAFAGIAAIEGLAGA